MPRDFLFTKEEIVKAALDLIRENGFTALTARALGNQLNTSSRPIFSHFSNMAEVQKAIIDGANEVYQSFRKQEIESGKYPPYKASGMAYIRFAREEKELFKLLFMRDRSKEEKDDPEEMNTLVCTIAKQVNVNEENAKKFYLEMWAYTHGIATMIATDYLDWDEEFTSRSVTDVYEGLKHRYMQKQVKK